MIKDRSWRKADYPNRIPAFHKRSQRYKETEEERVRRILKELDYDKLVNIGRLENETKRTRSKRIVC